MDLNIKQQLEVINHQIKEMVGIYRTAVGGSGISDNEFWIWYALIILEGELTQQDICGIWSLSKQTVNTIIMNMVKNGYAVLENVPNTRNKKKICLTSIGEEYGKSVVMPIFSAEQRALERLSEEERFACVKIFGKYIIALKEEMSCQNTAGER